MYVKKFFELLTLCNTSVKQLKTSFIKMWNYRALSENLLLQTAKIQNKIYYLQVIQSY